MIIELENGKKLEVQDGANPAQIDEAINHFSQNNPEITPEASENKPSVGKTVFDQAMQGATFGFADEITDPIGTAIASVAGKLNGPSLTASPALQLPEDVRKGLNPSMGDTYSEARATTKDALAAQQEQRPVLSTASQIGGGIVTGLAGAGTKVGSAIANRAGAGLLPQTRGLAGRAANLLTKSAMGAAITAPSMALYKAGTADSGQRLEQAKEGLVSGAAIGAAVPLATSAIGAGISAALPKIDEGFAEVGKLAQKYKIPVSIDELTSSRAVKNIQKVSQELPFSGQAGFRDKQMKAFNRALTKTIGAESDSITPQVMDMAFEKVGKEFDSLGRGKTFAIGPEFNERIASILDDAAINSTDDAIKNFNKGVERVLKNANPDGTISGEKLSFLRSNLNQLSRKASSPDTAELLKDLENAVIDLMTAGDDVAKETLSQAKYKYKNLLALEPLAQKAKNGNISVTQLSNRVARIYGREFTRGRAGELGDLARIGNELLPELGGSDTIPKAAYLGAGIAGAGIANPKTLIPTAAFLAGNRVMQSGINRNPALVNRMIQGSTAQLTGPNTAIPSLVVPVYLDPRKQALEGKGPPVNLPNN